MPLPLRLFLGFLIFSSVVAEGMSAFRNSVRLSDVSQHEKHFGEFNLVSREGSDNSGIQ